VRKILKINLLLTPPRIPLKRGVLTDSPLERGSRGVFDYDSAQRLQHKKNAHISFTKYLTVCMVFLSISIAYAEDTNNVYQLGEISVTPGKFSIDESAPSQYLIPKSQMDELPLIDNDVYRAAQTLPGVVGDDFSARFSLRGSDRNETVTKLDGMELYDPYHLQDFGGAISVIDLGIVKHADLLMGGFPAEYGDAMSGVFDVVSGGGIRDKFGGDVGVDILNAHAIFDAPVLGGSWLMSARRGYIDLLMGLIPTQEVFRPQYYDIYSKMTRNVSPADKLSANILYAGDSDTIDEIGVTNDIKSKYWNGIAWGKWNHIFGENSLVDSYVFLGKAGGNRYEGIDGKDKRALSYTGLKSDLTYGLGKQNTLKSGFRWQFAQGNYDFFLREDDTPTSAKADLNGWNMDGYAQDDWRIMKILGGNFGLRFMYQNDGDYFSIMPRFALAVKPISRLTVRGAWGKYDQPVGVMNIPVEVGISEVRPPEKADHYVLSAEYLPTASWFVRTEAYYKTYDDLVGRIMDYGIKERFFVPPKSGDAKGIELYLRNSPTAKLTWSLGYALAKSDVETESGKVPRNYDRRHSIILNANYAVFTDGWISVVWRYHSGEPYTQAWYEKTSDGEWVKIYGAVNGKRLPPYNSLDIRLSKNYQFRKWSMSVYIQVMNLYNRKNVQEYSFEQMTDKQGNIYYQRVTQGFLPILPTFGVSAQF